MAVQTVPIRLTHLLCPDLSPCTKLVALGLQLDQHLDSRKRHSPSRLRHRLGPSRTTIRNALTALAEAAPPNIPNELQPLSEITVTVREDLVTDKSMPALARVLYCILLGLHKLERHDILSSYAEIAEIVQLQARTVRRAVYALEQAGWLAVSQRNKHAPVRISFPDPVRARQRAEVRRARQVLEKTEWVGESLVRLWCDTLVASGNYRDNHYVEFLINPKTNELLQADRYYVDQKVIIEFQGLQHDGATERFSEEEAMAQMERDRIKREVCARLKVPLIELRPDDLTFDRLRELLGKWLPLQKRSKTELIIRFLERKSRSYRTIMKGVPARLPVVWQKSSPSGPNKVANEHGSRSR